MCACSPELQKRLTVVPDVVTKDGGGEARNREAGPQGGVASDVHARFTLGHAAAHKYVFHHRRVHARLGHRVLDRMPCVI